MIVNCPRKKLKFNSNLFVVFVKRDIKLAETVIKFDLIKVLLLENSNKKVSLNHRIYKI